MEAGLDEVFPPSPAVWAELARYEMAGDHRFGQAVRFLEEGCTDPKALAAEVGIKEEYAAWLLGYAQKMKLGVVRVVVDGKNDGRESASLQAHHYRYVLDNDLTPETRRYVETVLARFRSINPDISMMAANPQGAQHCYELSLKAEPALCANANCEWAWTHHGGSCS
ncbi:hypothetical protein H7J86_05515 [Mycobacterium hackensackense]|uniref:hypothetical protein n=1 Tax=Mycobacterium hackensackense TaxID=228909 RepID=UPI002265ADA7|nr:hypothetical protein [Mycobacterium hackensackense]MCV7251614.1 hypothetical protein [Mycobacterium hackensackense]